MQLYELFMWISGSMLAGMVIGAFLFNKLLKNDRDTLQITNMKLQTEIKMADLSLAATREANLQMYDIGFKDGKVAQIKELGKALLSESTVLSNGSIAKMGPKKGAA